MVPAAALAREVLADDRQLTGTKNGDVNPPGEDHQEAAKGIALDDEEDDDSNLAPDVKFEDDHEIDAAAETDDNEIDGDEIDNVEHGNVERVRI